MSVAAMTPFGAARSATELTLRDPIRASQHVFRLTLDALANPGSVHSLIVHPRVVLSDTVAFPYLGSLLVTLLDHEVSVHFADALHFADLSGMLVKRTRVALADAATAMFAVAHRDSIDPGLPELLQRGSLAFPDDGATLIIAVTSLDQAVSGGMALRLSGPGIATEQLLIVSGLSMDVLDSRTRATSNYPKGIDLLLIDDEGRLAGLPRTTQITQSTESEG